MSSASETRGSDEQRRAELGYAQFKGPVKTIEFADDGVTVVDPDAQPA
jgi:hypothetical protein